MIKKLIHQFSKFVVVGFINTGIDFGILNLLMWLFHIYSGTGIILMKTAAFLVANVNSYLMHKFWTFAKKDTESVGKEYGQFFSVSLFALGIHLAVVYSITTYIPPLFNIGPQLWANIANVLAVAIVLMWNFVGYKFIVFKK